MNKTSPFARLNFMSKKWAKLFLFTLCVLLLSLITPHFANASEKSSSADKNKLNPASGNKKPSGQSNNNSQNKNIVKSKYNHQLTEKHQKTEKQSKTPKDEVLEWTTRFFLEADSIHREAWWVLAGYRVPVTKTPFGKVARAIQSFQDIKLANKSIFRCDRYLVNRTAKDLKSYPQQLAVLEQCNLKAAARKIADVTLQNKGQVQVVFYPHELKELLGDAAATLNRPITCQLRGGDKLQTVKCSEWHQKTIKDLSIKLDVYEFNAQGTELMKFSGKVYNFLADVRKIETIVPKVGKIVVKEEELYPEEEEVAAEKVPEPKPSEDKKKTAAKEGSGQALGNKGVKSAPVAPVLLPAGRDQIDPDIQVQRGNLPTEQSPENSSANSQINDGWPTDENGNPLPVMGEDGKLYSPEGMMSPKGEGQDPDHPAQPIYNNEVDPNAR